MLGPKVMDWADRRVLLEAGVTIDRAGRRITGVEPREVDQGQHDGDRDVMAVSSAGMLVRRDVWDQVGGFDPAMPLLRDDVNFCWRVHAAGHRVRVVTDAVVYHLEATARNRRAPSAAPRPHRMDRHNALLTLLANLPLWPALSALAGNLVLSALRTVFFLLAKRPRAALDELAAVTSVLGHPLQLAAARRRRARGRRAAYSLLRPDLPPGRSVRRLAEFAASVFYTSTQIDTAGSHHATDDPSDDDFMLVNNGLAQRILTHPGVLLVAGLTVIALIAERSLLGAGTLSGGALTPAWGGASALWHEYLQGFHPAGIGSASPTPPYVAIIAALATVLGGKPWLAIDVIMIGCIPLAGLAAFVALRRVTGSVLARVWAASAYALLPVGMGAVAAGRFGSAVVFALIPLIALLAARIFTEVPRRARRAAWATGLAIAIAAAFVPLIWVVAVLGTLLAAAALRRAGRGLLLNLGITAVVAPVLLLPWTVQVATQPSLLFLEAGNKVPGLATAALPARSLLLLSPGGPGLPPFWVTGGLALAALAALLLTARRPLIMAGWSVALLGLVVSTVVSRMLLTTDDASKRVPGWPGISLAIAAGGLVIAAAVAADVLPAQLGGGRWRRPAGLGVLILAAAACSAPLLAAGSWVATGVRGPVGGAAGPVLPPFVSVSSDNGLRPRTLVLRAERGTVTYEVLRGADPLLGATDLTQPAAAQRTLDAAVSTLVAQGGGDAHDQGQALAALGIGYVLLPAPADAALAGTLNNVADLRPVSRTAGFQLWRVAQTTARVRVAEPGGKLVTVPSGPVSVSGAAAPRAGGTLELAEPAVRLDRHPQRHRAPVRPVAGRRLGASLPAPARRRHPRHLPLPAGPDPDRRAGRTSPAGRDRAGAARRRGARGKRRRGHGGAASGAPPRAWPRPGRGRSRRSGPGAGELTRPRGCGTVPGWSAVPPGRGCGRPGGHGRGWRAAGGCGPGGWRARAAGRGGRIGRGGTGHARPERPGTRRAAQRAGCRQAWHPGCLPPLRTARKRGSHRGRRGRAGEGHRTGCHGRVRGRAGRRRTRRRDGTDRPTVSIRPGGLAETGSRRFLTRRPAAAPGGRTTAPPCWVTGQLRPGRKRALRLVRRRLPLNSQVRGSPPRGWARQRMATRMPAAAAVNAGAWAGRRRPRTRRNRTPGTGTQASGEGSGTAPEQEAAAEYPPDPYASSAYLETAGTGPRRGGSARASGPYPGPSGGSGEYASEAGRGRVRRGGADDRVPDEQGWDYTGAERARAGYSGTGYDGAGGSGAGYDGGGGSGPDYGAAGRSGSGPAGYGGTGYGSTGYGSGEYPQPGPDDARRVSRGRLPGDDDLLLPAAAGRGVRRLSGGGGRPRDGVPPGRDWLPGRGRTTPALRGRARTRVTRRVRIRAGAVRPGAGTGMISPGTRSDPGGSSPAWSSPGGAGSVWEPAPVRGSNPAEEYSNPGYPGTEYPGPGYAGGEEQVPGYPASGQADGRYPGSLYPGHDGPGRVDPGRRYPEHGYAGTRRPGVRPGLRVVLRHGIPRPRLSRPRGPLLQPCARGMERRSRRRASGG